MPKRIQSRRDTPSNWTSVNPVLGAGEHGYEIGTGKEKIGDGVTVWSGLPYRSDDAANRATFVRFVDLAGNPITARHVTIKVDTSTWEIADITAEV